MGTASETSGWAASPRMLLPLTSPRCQSCRFSGMILVSLSWASGPAGLLSRPPSVFTSPRAREPLAHTIARRANTAQFSKTCSCSPLREMTRLSACLRVPPSETSHTHVQMQSPPLSVHGRAATEDARDLPFPCGWTRAVGHMCGSPARISRPGEPAMGFINLLLHTTGPLGFNRGT